MQPEKLDPTIINLTKAIRQTESGGNFNARGGSGEFGAYQYTQDTWNGASKKYGVNATLEQATPKQQNEVTYKRVKEWKDKGNNVGQIASMWNAGEGKPNAYKENWKGVNKFGVAYDTPAYAKKVAKAYQGYKGQTQKEPTQAPTQKEPTGFFQNIAEGRGAFPAVPGGNIAGNVFRTAGNLPGASYNLARDIASPINPLDLNHPLNIGSNIAQGGKALRDIYKSRGLVQGTKDIAGGFVDTGKKIGSAIGGAVTGTKKMIKERGVVGTGIEAISSLAEATINDPTLIPSFLYAPKGVLPRSRDLISDIASPVTKTTERVKKTIKSKTDAKVVSSREKTLNELNQKNTSSLGRLAEENPGVVGRVAKSNVLAEEGLISKEGKIVGANEASKTFAKQEIGEANKAVGTLLEMEGADVELAILLREMKRTARESIAEEGARELAIRNIEKEIKALSNANPNGRVRLFDLHKSKSQIYEDVYGKFKTPGKQRAKKARARAYKETIEKYSKENVEKINNKLEQLYNDKAYIKSLQGKQVGSGKLSGMVRTGIASAVGSIAGGAVGGIGGAIVGGLAAKEASQRLAGRAARKTFGRKTGLKTPQSKVLSDAVSKAKAPKKEPLQLTEGAIRLPAPKDKISSIKPPAVKKKSSSIKKPGSKVLSDTISKGEDIPKILRGTKGMTADQIQKQYPNIRLTKDVVAKDVYGNTVKIPDGEKLTPYEMKDGKIVLQDGQAYVVSKNQFANIKGNSVGGEAKPFAPELAGTEETVKGASKWEGDDLVDNGEAVATLSKNDDGTWSFTSDFSEGSDTFSSRAKAMEEAEMSATGIYSPNETKFSSQTLPGGKNYRETIHTDPKFPVKPDSGHFDDAASWHRSNIRDFKKTNDTYFLEEVQKGKHLDDTTNHPLARGKYIKAEVQSALKEAVDNNSEYFAWINGEQTSARYSLATKLEKVDWEVLDSGKKEIVIYPKDGAEKLEIRINKEGTITDSFDRKTESYEGKKLDEVLGKGLADKIMAEDIGGLSGDGLKFGGEWANTLYDKQVGNIVKDLTGGKVEVLDMGLPIKKNTTKFIKQGRDAGGTLTKSDLKVGLEINKDGERDYIITDVLGDGEFKAVPKNIYEGKHNVGGYGNEYLEFKDWKPEDQARRTETFDISSKTTTQQGIRLTPEIKAKIRGEALDIKTSGKQFEDTTSELRGEYQATKNLKGLKKPGSK